MATYQDRNSWTTQYEEIETWVETFAASDSLVPGVTDSLLSLEGIGFSASDTLVPQIVDSLVSLSGGLEFSSSDTLAPQVGESATLDTGSSSAIFTYIDPGTWANASQQYHDQASWTEGSAVISKFANDTLLIAIVEAPIASAFITTDDAITPGFSETATIPTLFTASDTLVPVLTESYSLNQGGVVPVSAADTLLVSIVEVPITVAQVITDDAIVPEVSENAVLDTGAVVAKSATDTLLVSINEVYTLEQSGSLSLSASDTLLVAVNEVAVLGGTNFLYASDTLVPLINEVGWSIVPVIAYSGSDVLMPTVDDAVVLLRIFKTPPGALPPDWYELELSELAGIAQPWLTDPNNVTPVGGWYARTYWAVYDEKGNLRVTDAWQNAARNAAWTLYQADLHGLLNAA